MPNETIYLFNSRWFCFEIRTYRYIHFILLQNLGPDSTANAIAQAMQQGTKIRPEIKIGKF